MPAKHKAGTRKARGSSRVKRTMKGGGGLFGRSKPVILSNKATTQISKLTEQLNSLKKKKKAAETDFRKTVATATNIVVPTWTNAYGFKHQHTPEYRSPSLIKQVAAKYAPMELAKFLRPGNQARINTSNELIKYKMAKQGIQSVKKQIEQIQKTGTVHTEL
jgi:hypothetical protein